MKYIITCLLISIHLTASTQSNLNRLSDYLQSNAPHFKIFIDSVEINNVKVVKLEEKDIANVSIIKNQIGVDFTKRGSLYIETNHFVAERFWVLLGEKHAGYRKVVPAADDSTVLYILNGTVLKEKQESYLALLNRFNLKRVQLLNAAELEMKYGIFEKRVGVEIEADLPGKGKNVPELKI